MAGVYKVNRLPALIFLPDGLNAVDIEWDEPQTLRTERLCAKNPRRGAQRPHSKKKRTTQQNPVRVEQFGN
jgi:hypothetical protein